MTVSPATIHEFKPRRPDPLGEASAATPYPMHALGDVLAPAAEAIATTVQCSPETAAHSVLSVATLAAQAIADVEMPYGQAKPCSLFFATVCESGERKTAADNHAMAPVRMRERNLREAYETARPGFVNAQEAWEAARQKARQKNKTFDAIKDALEAIGPEPEGPLLPILTTSDLTVEGLYRAFEDAHPALGVFTSEGAQVVAGHAMNQDNRLKSAAALSALWDGSEVRRFRAGDGVSTLPGRRLAAHLMFQPGVARQFLSDPALEDQGFIARFLVAQPEPLAGTRFYREPEDSFGPELKRYTTRVLALFERPYPMAEGRRNELDLPALPFEPDGAELWKQFHDAVEQQCGRNGNLAEVRRLASKMPEHAARLACVLQLVTDPTSGVISAESTAHALTLAKWYLSEAVRLWESAQISKGDSEARTLLDWVYEKHLPQRGDILSLRDIYQRGPRPMRPVKVARRVSQMLVASGHFLPVEGQAECWRIVTDGGGNAA